MKKKRTKSAPRGGAGRNKKKTETKKKWFIVDQMNGEKRERKDGQTKKKQNNYLFTRKSNSSFIFSTLKYMSAFLLPFSFGVDEFLYFIFYVFFNKTKITKILTRKSDSIFCCPKIFYFLYFFLFFALKNMLLLVREGWRELRSGGQREKTFFASFKQFFFCFLCVYKKRKKELILMR